MFASGVKGGFIQLSDQKNGVLAGQDGDVGDERVMRDDEIERRGMQFVLQCIYCATFVNGACFLREQAAQPISPGETWMSQ